MRTKSLLVVATLAIGYVAGLGDSSAQIVVDYNFTVNQNVPDNGQLTDIRTLGGLATFTDANVRLNLTTPNAGNPMFLGDMYSTLTYGTASEANRVAVLLNRPGRDNSNAFGSSLSSLNVTLDESASTNVWATTSSTGTYLSDGRLGVDPYAAGVAFSNGDRSNTLSAINGSALPSNKFVMTVADTSAGGAGRLSTWGLTLTGTTAGSGTLSAGTNGTMAISDTGSGATNIVGANVVATQSTGGPLVVNIAGSMNFAGGVTGSGGLTKQGTGTLTVSSAGTYSGATVIAANGGSLVVDNNNTTSARLSNTSSITVNSGGTLAFAQSGGTASSDRINNSAAISIAAGGKLDTASLSEGTAPAGPSNPSGAAAGLGALTLAGSSGSHVIIDFGTGTGSTLFFSSLASGADTYVDILNWTGAAGFDSGSATNDRWLFASNPNLSQAQLSNFSFAGFAPGATIFQYGGQFEIVPVPEPSTWAAGILTVLAVAYTQRRRLRAMLAPAKIA